jgi:hypothetical protein
VFLVSGYSTFEIPSALKSERCSYSHVMSHWVVSNMVFSHRYCMIQMFLKETYDCEQKHSRNLVVFSRLVDLADL